MKAYQLKRVNIDTTVQEKDIRFPTDARSYDRAGMRDALNLLTYSPSTQNCPPTQSPCPGSRIGVQDLESLTWISIDSGFRRNDIKTSITTFYGSIKQLPVASVAAVGENAAQLRMTLDDSRLCATWLQELEPIDPENPTHAEGNDIWFRRIKSSAFPANVAPISLITEY